MTWAHLVELGASILTTGILVFAASPRKRSARS